MIRTLKRLGAAAVVTLVAVGLAWVEPAAAAPACGTTITVSTTLDADVGPCPNGGLVVGADNITLDLGGHRVFGTANKGDGAGIRLTGRQGVTVANGTVSDFDAGILIEGGRSNTVRSVTARDNIGAGTGVLGDGIAIRSSNSNQLIGNTASNNGPFSGISIVSPSTPSTGNLVQGNVVYGNVIGRDGGTANTDNDGIRVENFSANTRIIGNRSANNGLDGISIFADNQGAVLQQNTVTGNGFFRSTGRRGSGIIVFNRSTQVTVEDNTVQGNADSGIDIRPQATSNFIRRNQSVQNSARPPIAGSSFGPSFDLKDSNEACDNNTWFANRYRTANPACTTTGGQQV